MDERSFEIGNKKFKLNKMDPFKQYHVVRRLSPMLSEMIPIAQKFSQNPKLAETSTEALAPILNGISKLSDADSEMVLMTLLGCVEMQQAPVGNWARLVIDGRLMFQDLELPLMLQIAGRAFSYNMKGFFSALPQASG